MLDIGFSPDLLFRCSLNILRMFSGCSDGSCERGGSGRSFGSSSSGGSCGSSGFGGSCESDLIQKYF